MRHEGDEVHIDETEASGGSKEGVVRWVLVIGLFAAIALLTIIWVTGALTQGEVEEEGTASGRVEAMESSDEAEWIIRDDADEIEAAPEPDGPESEALDMIEN